MKNKIGIMGLGVMGSSIALNLANHGYTVALYNKTVEKTKKLETRSPYFKGYEEMKEWIDSLEKPRKILLMVAAFAVDDVIESLIDYLEAGDILIDGGNSFYKDSQRRMEYCLKKKIYFIGMGISGGEEGALKGPSMMPSGDERAYKEIEVILKSIAAKTDLNEPCVDYIGERGSGHFVKMVHNAIEYADMQLLAETYMALKKNGYHEKEISKIFRKWNEGRLKSYLLEISADILEYEENGDLLVTKIKEQAHHKKTGQWSSLTALQENIAIPSLIEALQARYLSTYDKIPMSCETKKQDNSQLVAKLEKSLYLSKIMVYHQGFEFMKQISEKEDWHLNLASLARIWQKGCIIQSSFLKEIMRVYLNDTDLLHDRSVQRIILNENMDWREALQSMIGNGVYAPVHLSALTYFDGLRSSMGMNLIQAQRDYFGAHTYERTDLDGVYHTEWK